MLADYRVFCLWYINAQVNGNQSEQIHFPFFMSDIDKKVLETIETHRLLTGKDHVLAAVSGGPDSICLLLLLRQLFAGITLTAAYIDHNLRPDESPAEKELIEDLCSRLGAGFATESIDIPGEHGRSGESIEACARRLRFQALGRISQTLQADCIAVGHTADDQVEEVLLRLIRGSGLKGLSGMDYRNGSVIRPLLDIGKEHVLSHLARHGCSYCEDSSNQSDRFLRNRIRLELLPMLESRFNPSIRKTVINTANRLGLEESYMSLQTDHLYGDVVGSGNDNMEQKAEQKTVGSAALAGAHPALRRRVIERICWELDCRPDHRKIAAIDQMLCRGITGTELHLPDRLRVVKQDDSLLFARIAEQRSSRDRFVEPVAVDVQITAPGEFLLRELGLTVTIEVIERRLEPGPGVNVLDAELLSFPLRLRSPQPGDRFTPFGSSGSKKVARFLGDKKVPAHRRGRYPVLECSEGIVCVAGLEIDDRYRVTGQTQRSVRIEIVDNQF